MPDQEINCIDCKMDFSFSEGERAFYDSRGLTEPKRCANCRAVKKAKRAEEEETAPTENQLDFFLKVCYTQIEECISNSDGYLVFQTMKNSQHNSYHCATNSKKSSLQGGAFCFGDTDGKDPL